MLRCIEFNKRFEIFLNSNGPSDDGLKDRNFNEFHACRLHSESFGSSHFRTEFCESSRPLHESL